MLNASRIVRQIATLTLATGLVLGAAACPPPEPEPEKPKPPTKPPEPKSQDFVFDDLDEVKLTGVRFTPEGFGYLGMMRVTSPRKNLTIAKQRRFVARAKGAKKVEETKVLVTLLWDESKTQAQAGAKEEAEKLRTEARDLLLELDTNMSDQVDAAVLRMLFTAELWLQNTQGALAAGAKLHERFADSGHTKAINPWLAFLHLTSWQTAEAAKIAQGWAIGAEDTDYLRAYIVAWVAFRQRDYAKAREAIIFSAKNWKSSGTFKAVRRDLVLILSRSGTPVNDAVALFAELTEGNAEQQYVWLYELYQGYELSGYPLLATEALDRALAILGDKVPVNDRVAILQRQSNSYLVAHKLDKTVDALIAAYKAVAPCGDKCAGKDEEIAQQIAKLAPHFHTTYATTQDPAYYDAAKKLYEFYLTLNRSDQETLRGYLGRLEETKQRAQPGTGKHDKETMAWSTSVRQQEVKACYEEVLQSEPELTGSAKVTLNIEHTGKVTGVETDPAQGEQGLAAVGGCIQNRARDWTFPARSIPGTTAVVRTFVLEPEAPAQP